MKIVIAADHGGFAYKEIILQELKEKGYEVTDLGAFEALPADDYPDYATAVASAIVKQEAGKGILICGSGVGVSVAANKFKGVRAAICHDTYSAHQGVEHDNMNVLCFGERVIGIELAKEIVFAFLAAAFSNEERHVRRFNKMRNSEESNFK